MGPVTNVTEAAGESLVRWLIGLRWAIVGILAMSLPASAAWLSLPVAWPVAAPAVALMAIANGVAAARARDGRVAWRPALIAAGVAFDMVGIAVVLGASGGPANPFSALLFVYVALAASLLPARLVYALGFVAACTFGALFALPRRAHCEACEAREGMFSTHLVGMWVAFALGALLIVFFLTRVRRAMEARDQELARLRKAADDAEKFAALGTLAAGAAHELATPLGTISILARELAEDRAPADAATAIGAQVERCRDVLKGMQPGARRTDDTRAAILGRSVEHAVKTWRAAHPDGDVVCGELVDLQVALSEKDLEAALGVLLDNAHFATRRAGVAAPIRVSASATDEGARIEVRDEGVGIAPELTGRIGEPFLTTKDPGEGMGLGLYLVRTLLADVGGRLEVAANEPRGALVSIIVGAG